MDSSRDGYVRKLNGHGAGAGENGRQHEAPQPQLPGLVDELAQAMGMARDSLERPDPANMSAAAAPLPAMSIHRSLFDDEEDDAAMPIPSTWRAPPEPPDAGPLRDQLRAAALGFATGLAVIVPVVLLLTGRFGDVSFDALLGGSEPLAPTVARTTVVPAQLPVQVQQRTVSTTLVTPAQMPQAAAVEAAATEPQQPQPAEAGASWSSAIAEGRARILSGDIMGGREMLGPAAAADEPEAFMALAETFDPNMLAAWGVRDVGADVQRARGLYRKALDAGLEPARNRLEALN
ncbi:MAG: hypothetical protein KJZ80_07590 [Hyphomicrobiaceae bacterium]|nr:hypothetical protein [Hyphomicrobiaceae bacterium]